MNRTQFLRSLAAGVGGLLVGDQALDAFERLTYKRRFFPGWSEPRTWTAQIQEHEIDAYLAAMQRGTLYTFQEIGVAVPPPISAWFTPDVFGEPQIIRTYLDVRVSRVDQEWCKTPTVTFTT